MAVCSRLSRFICYNLSRLRQSQSFCISQVTLFHSDKRGLFSTSFPVPFNSPMAMLFHHVIKCHTKIYMFWLLIIPNTLKLKQARCEKAGINSLNPMGVDRHVWTCSPLTQMIACELICTRTWAKLLSVEHLWRNTSEIILTKIYFLCSNCIWSLGWNVLIRCLLFSAWQYFS